MSHAIARSGTHKLSQSGGSGDWEVNIVTLNVDVIYLLKLHAHKKSPPKEAFIKNHSN